MSHQSWVDQLHYICIHSLVVRGHMFIYTVLANFCQTLFFFTHMVPRLLVFTITPQYQHLVVALHTMITARCPTTDKNTYAVYNERAWCLYSGIVHPRALACTLGVWYHRSSGLGYLLWHAARMYVSASSWIPCVGIKGKTRTGGASRARQRLHGAGKGT